MHNTECIEKIIAAYKNYPYPNYHIAEFLIWLHHLSQSNDNP